MTLPSEASAISPGRSDRPAAANPPAESMVLERIARAHGLGRAGLTNLAIAQGCPSLRLDYLQRAAERLADAGDELADALAAQRLRNAAGETDCDDGVPSPPRRADDVSNAFFAAVLAEDDAMRPAAPGPNIRCNDCYAPADCDCAECRARNAERDARFGAQASYADPALTAHARTDWQDIVAPIVSRLRIAATFQSEAIFNAEGATAMAQVLEAMAKQLDQINQVVAGEMSHV